ncbi:MAG: hypothetical protein ACD_79C00188G0003 [uncultured bacterium]|nr:MAG: hypothetical protein ACD_79C00188G0003 [uncultured bacterium]
MLSQYEKLKDILREMFQMDQADLDFGIYRIMNAKRDEIEAFLDKDLLPQVKEEFGKYRGTEIEEKKKELTNLEKTIRDSGMNPDESPKIKGIREELAKYGDDESLANEVFSHLSTFFRRYYDKGDFLSMRRYKKDTYAIPYEGEEVKLHWANADQYYIKTSEYLRDYTFKLTDGKKAHFKLVDASQEKDNNKTDTGKERKFKLFEEEPIRIAGKEVYIQFVYQADKEKQDNHNKKTLEFLNGEFGKKLKDFSDLFSPAPTAKNPKRTFLEKHLYSYTARFNFDFFIHKDLGGFLRREMDFYVKNEVLFIDDLDAQDEKKLKSVVAKVKVIKHIAQKIIAFLAQLEDFQKKLWLKKKFIVDSGYCVTLDKVPETLYAEIAKNDTQREEWVKLFAIEEIQKDLARPGYTNPLKVEFLKANPYLVLDTKHFDEKFKNKLLASFENLDEACDGLIINSENFQALNLLQEKYNEKVKCVYIDPPYNTEQDRQQGKFIYKDSFESSSWLALMSERIFVALSLMKIDGTFFSSIDHNEINSLKYLCESIFQKSNFEGLISWRRRHNQPNDETKMIGMVAEYILSYAKNSILYKKAGVGKLDLTGDFSNPDNDPRGEWASKPWKVGSDQSGSRYKITTLTGKILDEEWMGEESTYNEFLKEGRIYFPKNGDGAPRKKYYKFEREKEGQCATNWWAHDQFGHNQGANDLMTSLFGFKNAFSNPKPIELIRGVLLISNTLKQIILDYFAGSGTTAHAVINLNREDGGKRKYILVEMGEYFDTVLKPRIQKVVYSKDWKDGKPVSREGISHMFTYMRLESYDDTLDNLIVSRSEGQQKSFEKMGKQTKEDYTLSYMLNIESKASDSLLNIDRFSDPFNYTLKIRKDNELKDQPIDIVESFNYLIGLYVEQTETIRGFKVVRGKLRTGEKTLIIWRNTKEKSNEDLDEFFKKQKYNTLDFEFDLIFVNGDNNLENLKLADDKWKVRMIEEEFKKRMFEMCGV